jgi:hypothetical protein
MLEAHNVPSSSAYFPANLATERTMRAEAYGDDVSCSSDTTVHQINRLALKDGETSYYEFSLKRQVFVQSRSSKIQAASSKGCRLS